LLTGFADPAELVDAVVAAILLRYHTQAGGAAIHYVQLFVKGVFHLCSKRFSF